jgi:light-regulated signal transduction histidine kinase (bacteriophytochrome)
MKHTENHLRSLQQKLDREVLLHRTIDRIRQSLELEEILTATAAEIRSFLETDRVMVYRFNPDSSGEVIAESIDEGRLCSLKGLNFPPDDIPLEARERFLQRRVRSIVKVNSQQIGLSPFNCNGREDPGEREQVEISYRPLDSCHMTYLKAMGVYCSLVVPIIANDELWGLIVSHHAEERDISEEDLQLVQLVTDQVSIAIAQATLLAKTRERQAREATINRIATLLHGSPEIELQGALEATVQSLDGCGGRVYIAPAEEGDDVRGRRLPEIFAWGDRPTFPDATETPILEEHPQWRQWRERRRSPSHNSSQLYERADAIADLYKDPSLAAIAPAFKNTQIRGLLVIPLYYRQKFLGYLSIFRHEVDTETLWAGRFNSNVRQLMPRQSFEAWRELKKNQARKWTDEEVQMAKALGDQFSMAIGQYLLYKEVTALNANLEYQVQQRTAQLQNTLKFTRILKQVSDRIRSTLDLDEILQTIVGRVRNLLNTDRVVIYQFRGDGTGEVTVEDVRGNWKSVLGTRCPGDCFPQAYGNLYLRGRVRAIDDIAMEDLTPCHREFLESLQVKANLIVPIRMGSDLWGLTIAHECQGPRVWSKDEIELVQQLGDQAAIAISQAELYRQSQHAAATAEAKARELTVALQDLQHAQGQLVQSEKMSSLGQLVAGVAHEINNPVNFIYGNLAHATEYAHDLLELLDLYQKHLPEPDLEIVDLMEDIDFEFLVEDLPRMLASMKVGADRIRQIVLSLRNFSRLDQSEMKPVNIHDGIDSTLMILHHRIKAKGDRPAIEIVKNYGDLPSVECYAGQLNQVFMNILGNAIDALEEAWVAHSHPDQPPRPTPSIRITTERHKNHTIAIEIGDNGPGIPEHLKNRIFDPFFTTKDIGKGTGMGLSISHQIVAEKHGGQFECESEPGNGTTFRIVIPIAAVRPSPEPTHPVGSRLSERSS